MGKYKYEDVAPCYDVNCYVAMIYKNSDNYNMHIIINDNNVPIIFNNYYEAQNYIKTLPQCKYVEYKIVKKTLIEQIHVDKFINMLNDPVYYWVVECDDDKIIYSLQKSDINFDDIKHDIFNIMRYIDNNNIKYKLHQCEIIDDNNNIIDINDVSIKKYIDSDDNIINISPLDIEQYIGTIKIGAINIENILSRIKIDNIDDDSIGYIMRHPDDWAQYNDITICKSKKRYNIYNVKTIYKHSVLNIELYYDAAYKHIIKNDVIIDISDKKQYCNNEYILHSHYIPNKVYYRQIIDNIDYYRLDLLGKKFFPGKTNLDVLKKYIMAVDTVRY